MSILMKEIAHINHHLLQENRDLKEQIEQKNKNEEYDQRLFLELSRKYKEALEKIERLEAELNELRGMHEQSEIPSTRSPGTSMPDTYARSTMRGPYLCD